MVDRNNRKSQEIGNRLKIARETKGWTQTQLAQKLNNPLTGTAISLYESGDRDVSVEILEELAKVLEVDLEYLVTGSKEDNTTSIKVALRSDKHLSDNQKAQEQILDFIEFVKKKNKDK